MAVPQLPKLKSEDQEIAPLKKLCALVIGHKKSSPGAVNERGEHYQFVNGFLMH